MDAGEILDGAFSLYRRHRGAFVLAGALPLLPLLAVWAGLAVDAWRGGDYGEAQADGLLALALLGGWLPATLTRAAVIRMAADAQLGRPVHPRAALADALRRLPAALWAGGLGNLLVALPLVGGMALLGALAWSGMGAAYWVTALLMWLTPAALAAPWFGTLPAVVLEGAGGHGARIRSWTLTRAAPAKVAAVWSVTFLLGWLPWVATGAVLVATDTGLANGRAHPAVQRPARAGGGAGRAHPGRPAGGGVAMQASLPTEPQVRAALERVYARPELAPPEPGPLDGIRAFFGRLMGRLFDWLNSFGGLRTESPIVYWLVMGSLIALGLGIVIYFIHNTLLRLGAAEPVIRLEAGPGGAIDARARTAAEWEDEARRAAAAGRYRDASVALYQALLLRLEAAGTLRYDPAKTPGDYRREARRSPQAAGALTGFLRGFERLRGAAGEAGAHG